MVNKCRGIVNYLKKCFCIILIVSTANAQPALNIPLHTAKLQLNPTGIQDRSALWVSRQINCQLVRTEGGVLTLEAARSIRYITPLKIAITLNPQAHFHDGSPVTADDVVASFNFLKTSRRVLLNIFSWVKNIQVINKNEIIVTLSKPIPEFLKVLSSPNYAIFKKTFLIKAKAHPELWNYPMGCGGYYVVKNTNTLMTIKPLNPDSLTVNFYLLASNQISPDMISHYNIINIHIAGKSHTPPGFRKINIFDPRQIYLGINSNLKPWQNRRNRCALLAKVKRNIIKRGYGDNARPANDFVPAGVLGYQPAAHFIEDIRQQYAITPLPPLKHLCLSYLSVSIPQQFRRPFVQALSGIAPSIQTKVMTNDKQFGKVFSSSNCDLLAFDLKSNYLDAYEFILILSESDANFSGYYNDNLQHEIENSQNIANVYSRIKEYRKIINRIKKLCLIEPIVTLPYETIFVNNTLITPHLGSSALNDYYLGLIRWKK